MLIATNMGTNNRKFDPNQNPRKDNSRTNPASLLSVNLERLAGFTQQSIVPIHKPQVKTATGPVNCFLLPQNTKYTNSDADKPTEKDSFIAPVNIANTNNETFFTTDVLSSVFLCL